MRRLTATLVLSLSLFAIAWAQGAKPAPEAARAEEVLKKARAALGSEAKLKSIQSLSASGKFRRIANDREITGEIQFDLMLPDKYLKSETMNPVPSVSITSIDIINGENVVLDAKVSGPGNIIYNRPGGANSTPEAKAAAQRAAREEYGRMLIGWLLTSPSTFPVEFKYAGEAEAPDGRADVLEVKGPNNFVAHLFLDSKSHIPLMLAYKAPAPRGVMTTSNGKESQEAIKKRIEDQMAKAKSAPSEVDVQIRFLDYRAVDGVLFPSRITKEIDGQASEEWKMSNYKINPSLGPEKFEKKGA